MCIMYDICHYSFPSQGSQIPSVHSATEIIEKNIQLKMKIVSTIKLCVYVTVNSLCYFYTLTDNIILEIEQLILNISDRRHFHLSLHMLLRLQRL